MPSRVCAVTIWVGCLLLAAACAGTGRGDKPELGAEQLQQMGEKYLAAGETGLALQFLTSAEKMKPDDPVIQYDLGLAYGARGLPDEALAHLERAMALKPDYAEAANASGILYAERGQLAQAETAFRKALSNPFYPTPQYALFNLARLYEKRGDLRAALENYQKAVQMQPSYATAFLRMGIIQEGMGRQAEALQNYEKALQYNPNLAEALLHVGVLSYRAGAADKARDCLAQVVRLSPDSDFAAEARKYLQMLPAGDGS